MIDERCGCGLAVRASDTYHLGVGIAASELYLAYYVNALCYDFLNHGSFVGNTRALNHLVGREYFLLCVMTFFPFDAMLVEHLLITVLYRAHVRHEDIEALFLCQNGCSGTAFSSA